MNNNIVTLANATEIHGGKAHGLRRLIEANFEVPAGLALSSDAVEQLLRGNEEVISILRSWLKKHFAPVAIRSSAAKEDSESLSFAGMFETKLDVNATVEELLPAIECVSASGTRARVAAYAGPQEHRIPVIVQSMVQARVSGVIFTSAVGVDGNDSLYLEWVKGLGDQLVSGRTKPARLTVPWERPANRIRRDQAVLVGDTLSPMELSALYDGVERLALAIAGAWDIEWSIDTGGSLWMLQMRPITRPILIADLGVSGAAIPASPGRAEGPAFVVDDEGNIGGFTDGDVLVAEITEVDFVPAMRRAAAIVTEQGGMLSHAAIVARELGKPCVVGVTSARSRLQPRLATTVDGSGATVQQGDMILGPGIHQEIDWRALCLYDRGIETNAGGMPLYIESLPVGITAYATDLGGVDQLAQAQIELRRVFRRNVEIVADQKLLWYWEWRRFHQLTTISFIESAIQIAIARWDSVMLGAVIEVIKGIARQAGDEHPASALSTLYVRELGAALHALCGVAVEGIGTWAAYRDSWAWRQGTGLSLSDLLLLPDSDSRVDSQVAKMRACLRVLSMLRNDAYPYFVSMGAFSVAYFESARAALVEQVCNEVGFTFESENSSLTSIYGLPSFLQHDKSWCHKVLARLPT